MKRETVITVFIHHAANLFFVEQHLHSYISPSAASLNKYHQNMVMMALPSPPMMMKNQSPHAAGRPWKSPIAACEPTKLQPLSQKQFKIVGNKGRQMQPIRNRNVHIKVERRRIKIKKKTDNQIRGTPPPPHQIVRCRQSYKSFVFLRTVFSLLFGLGLLVDYEKKNK